MVSQDAISFVSRLPKVQRDRVITGWCRLSAKRDGRLESEKEERQRLLALDKREMNFYREIVREANGIRKPEFVPFFDI